MIKCQYYSTILIHVQENKNLIEHLSQVAQIIEKAVSEAKAQNIKTLHVAHLTSVTDYLIICTGSSSRHMRYLADEAITALNKAGYEVLNKEGMESNDWIIVDGGDAVLHIMSRDAREFYQLEGLWDIAPEE